MVSKVEYEIHICAFEFKNNENEFHQQCKQKMKLISSSDAPFL